MIRNILRSSAFFFVVALLISVKAYGQAPTASNFNPANGSLSASYTSNLLIYFSENIKKGTTGFVTIKKVADNSDVEEIDINSSMITINNNILTINPTNDLPAASQLYVTVDAGAILDLTDDPFAGINNTTTWRFTTAPPPLPPVFTSTPVTSVLENNWYGYGITASDPNNNVLTVTAPNGLPSWLNLVPSGGATTFANLPSSGGTMAFYNGYVYINVSGNGIMRVSPDGVLTQWYNISASDLQIYQGYMYIATSGKVIKVNPDEPVITPEDVLTGINVAKMDVSGGYLYMVASGSSNNKKVIRADISGTLPQAYTAAMDYVTFTGIMEITDLKVGTDGKLYVIDYYNVKRYNGSGNTLESLISGMTNPGSDLQMDGAGNFYISFVWKGEVRKYTPDFSSFISTISFGVDNITRAYYTTVTPAGTAFLSGGDASDWLKLYKRESNFVLTGTPASADVGVHSIKLRVSDGTFTADQDFTITVSDPTPPVANTFSPASGTTGLSTDATLSLTFSEAIQKGTGSVYIKKVSDNSIAQQIDINSSAVSISGSTLTIDPATDIPSLTNVYITIDNTAVKDIGGNAWAGISNNSTWTFTTTQGPPVFASTPITDINYGQLYSYTVTLTTESGISSVTAPTLPSWLTFQSGTRVSTLAGSNQGYTDATGSSAQFKMPSDVVVDAAGNAYVSDYENKRIRKVTPEGVVSTFAGDGDWGPADGMGTAAKFNMPSGLAIDASGNLYVSELGTYVIRKITPDGDVTTLAGGGQGSSDGPGSIAKFFRPAGLAVDGAGNVYVADQNNHRIRKITPAGIVSTLVGSGVAGFTDNTGLAAQFNRPTRIALDAAGNLYVTDQENHAVRKIDPALNVTTLAGNGISGFADGNGSAARFDSPSGITVDASSGDIYVADASNNRIRKITPSGEVSTIAGGALSGANDGGSSAARFSNPLGITLDASGTIYIADQGNSRIRKIALGTSLSGTPSKANVGSHPVVLTSSNSAGSKNQNFTITVHDPIPPQATAFSPVSGTTDIETSINLSVTYDEPIQKGTGFIYIKKIADGSTVQQIDISSAGVSISGSTLTIDPTTDIPSLSGVYITVDGTAIEDISGNAWVGISSNTTWTFTTKQGPPVFTSTPVTTVAYGQPYSYTPIVTAESGASAFTAPTLPSWLNYSVVGNVTTLAGNGNSGFMDGAAGTAQFYTPYGVAADNSGNVYVADQNNHRIRKITPGGVVSTFAGDGMTGSNDDLGTAARFNTPNGIAIDVFGNLYVTDSRNYTIRKISPVGQVTTYAGMSGIQDYVDGPSASARFGQPQAIALDGSGNVYVADVIYNNIRKISTSGEVSTFAGSTTGAAGYQDGASAVALFDHPWGITVDSFGNVYVADASNNRIRKITPSGDVSTVAGNGTQASVDGFGTSAQIGFPSGIAIDAQNNLYVSEFGSNRIRLIRPSGEVSTLAGSSLGYQDGLGSSAQFFGLAGLAAADDGHIFVADAFNHRIRKIAMNLTSLSGTPSKTDVGEHPVVLTATNSAGSTNQNFTITVTDAVAPQTIAFTPADNTAGIDVKPVLSISFDEEVKPGNSGTLIILAGGTPVRTLDLSVPADRALLSQSPDQKTITINLNFDLPELTAISVGMSPGFITDLSGNAYAGFAAASGNWTFTTKSRIPQTINFPAIAGKVYGDEAFILGDEKSSENLDIVYTAADPGLLSISGNVATILKAGSTTITASQPGNNSVAPVIAVDRPLTIDKKLLLVTADNKQKVRGTANPVLTISYSGFVNGDDSSVITTTPTLSTTADENSADGEYPITVSGGQADNYTFSFVPGTLKVRVGAATDIVLTQNPLYENQPAGTLAGTLSIVTDDSGASFKYTLLNGTGAIPSVPFSIAGDRILTTASLDAESRSVYSLTVRSTSAYGESFDKSIDLTVFDVNEAPTLDAITDQILCLTTEQQKVSLSGISAGPEENQNYHITVSSNQQGLFDRLEIVGEEIYFKLKESNTSATADIIVTVTDNGGTDHGGTDTYSRTFRLTANPVSEISISSDKGTTLSKGQIAALTATGGVRYIWSNADGIISGQNTAQLTVRPTETTLYTVTVTNENGCTVTRTITVRVLADYAAIDATNIISPNGDGVNDTWQIRNIDMYPNNQVRIFDKAGRPLYSQRNYRNDSGWDAKVDGNPLIEDTYYYIIDFGQGTKLKGYITVVTDR